MLVSIVGGSGTVGTILGSRLAAAGHAIFIGARDVRADKVAAAVNAIDRAASPPKRVSSGSIRAACDAADVVLLTTPGMPTAELLKPLADAMGPCTGKPVIDATNPLSAWPKLDIITDRNTTSASEELAKLLPECAGVYKAFNTIGTEVLKDPDFHGKPAAMLYSGPPESEARSAFKSVTKLISDVGFEPVYVGGARQARNLEVRQSLISYSSR